MRSAAHSARVVAILWAAGLAACTTTPEPVAGPAFDATAAIAAIREAGADEGRELVIRPLGDAEVADLRVQAEKMHARGEHAAAAVALDHALAITAKDPALLQERAEAALWLGDLMMAEELARRAIAAGSQVGPLCRRHWETIAQVRVAQRAAAPLEEAGVAEARRSRDACTIAAPNRF